MAESIAVQACRKRVDDSVTSMVNDLDQEAFRQMQVDIVEIIEVHCCCCFVSFVRWMAVIDCLPVMRRCATKLAASATSL